MPAEASGEELLALVRAEIGADGPMSFARFMELALYHPRHGYYSRGPEVLGRRGDFFTASDVGRHFGRCIARQLPEIDQAVGRAPTFDLVEIGAGRGRLARDVIDHLEEHEPDLARRLRVRLVDRSPAMREAARAEVPEAEVLGLEDLPPGLTGCLLAVELFDALPVHRLRRHEGALLEVRVGLNEAGELVETESPAEPGLVELAQIYGVAGEDPSEGELAPSAATLIGQLLERVQRGVLLIVDYGDRAERLYPPRPDGTLLAYHRHEAHTRLLERPGGQDLTAHVNFSILEQRAAAAGAQVLGLTTQDRFLIANGLLDAFSVEAGDWAAPGRTKSRLQAMQLIHPFGMGRTFRVLGVSRGLGPPPVLRGFSDPFGRNRPFSN